MSLEPVDLYIEFQPTLKYIIKSYLKILKTTTKRKKKPSRPKQKS